LLFHYVLAQEQQCVTYENHYFGVTIQHPSNWEVKFSNTDASPPAFNSFLILSDERITASNRGARSFAKVVFPTPGRPRMTIINIDIHLVSILHFFILKDLMYTGKE
jgi:hypothetical protein